jgi:hypothetical protein
MCIKSSENYKELDVSLVQDEWMHLGTSSLKRLILEQQLDMWVHMGHWEPGGHVGKNMPRRQLMYTIGAYIQIIYRHHNCKSVFALFFIYCFINGAVPTTGC